MTAPLRRVAVLSDIHGVLPALEAVLGEPEVAAADLVVATGDLAAGPQPAETLDALAALGDRAVCVRGNADRELVDGGADPEGMPEWARIGRWAAAQLTRRHRAFLAGLPAAVEREVAGLGRVLFCHATPRDDAEFVLVDSPPERWAEVLADVPAGVRTVALGHTHMPFLRLAAGRTAVNPGSVGMPYGAPGPAVARWALLGPGVELRETRFDVEAAAARIKDGSGFPHAAEWVEHYLRNPPTAEAALAAFTQLTPPCSNLN